MEIGVKVVFTLGNGVFVAGSNPAGGTFSFPLLPVNMLVVGGFCVLGITVFYSLLQSFAVAHVVEMSWNFEASTVALHHLRHVTTNTRQLA